MNTLQAPSAIIRPTAYANSGFGNPQNAIDTNLGSASGGNPGGRICYTHCIGTNTMACTWLNFPAGYVPLELKVRWDVSGAMGIVGDSAARVEGKIEYSLNGGQNWTEMETPYECIMPGCSAYPSHDVSVPLSSGQDTGLVQVRAKLDVTLIKCGNCTTNSTNVAGSISVYDVQIVAQRPAFRLFLDVDNNFNPANPQSDLDDYVPGSNLDGTSVPLPSSGTTLQTLTLIAAYVLPNGTLAKPADFFQPNDGTPNVDFSLTNTSKFTGIAMNYETSTGFDFYWPNGVNPFNKPYGTDNTVRISLECRDYGGFTAVKADSGPDTATLRIPKDDNGNWLPDGGWRLFANGQQYGEITDMEEDTLTSESDQDTNPNPGSGSTGDGFANFEEFRGVIVRGKHRRTNPYMKDLFIAVVTGSGQIPEQDNIGCAVNLQLTKHRINSTGETDSNLQVNFNRSNSGYGGAIPGPSPLQRALLAVNGGYDPNLFGFLIAPASQPDYVPNEVTRVEVYIETIRLFSPPTLDRTTEDPPDHDAIKLITGHEIGHGIHMDHRQTPPRPLPPAASVSVMVEGWFKAPGDPDYQYTWANVPCTYDDFDKDLIWLRRP
jgi:hypothetical protein